MEEKEETIAAEEIMSVGHVVNTFSCICIAEKKSDEEQPMREDLTQKRNN